MSMAKIPTKVAFFIWTAAMGKTLTIDNLRRQWVLVIEWCCTCKSAGIFFFIALLLKSYGVWCLFCLGSCGLWFGLEELLASWKGIFNRADNRMISNAIPIASCGVFGVRECSDFYRTEKDVLDLVYMVILFPIVWCGVFGKKGMLNF